MPRAEYFGQFGLFSQRSFLSTESCAQVLAEMSAARTTPGAVWNPHDGETIALETKRRTEMVGVPNAHAAVTDRLLAIMPVVAAHFGVELSGVQPLKFVRYGEGDYYRVHRDVPDAPDAPQVIRERKVSVVVFLGGEGEEPDEGDYCGGNLTFYGLLDDPAWQNFGHPLNGEAGLLVAFRPDTAHEVTPVTWGARHTITTWYR